jgi:hypothetical protein
MTRSKKQRTIFLTTALMAFASGSAVAQSTPKFTIIPALGTSGNVSVTPETTATITYTVTRNLSYTGNPWKFQSNHLGVTQVTTGEGACPASIVLKKGQSCLLILSIDGSKFPADSTSTLNNPALPVPQICEGDGTQLSCSQPSNANLLKVTNSPLSISLSTLVLAQKGIFTAASGADVADSTPRKFIITNTGSTTVTGIGIKFSPPLADSDASSINTCTGLDPLATCTVTITPGTPSSAGVSPAANTMTVISHLKASPMATIVTLTYGSLYGDGYVFSIDDSTPDTQSVGPVKVLATADQSGVYGELWSQSSQTYSIWGIDELSTVANPSPNASTPAPNTATPPNPLPGQSNCQGNSDGACNSNNISVLYAAAHAASSTYAEHLCQATIGSYNDWYFPAICEMGYFTPSSYSSTCGLKATPLLQNMQSNLIDFSGSNTTISDGLISGGSEFFPGFFWSSTENSLTGQYSTAWGQVFTADGSKSTQGPGSKNILPIGVRCVRVFTP